MDIVKRRGKILKLAIHPVSNRVHYFNSTQLASWPLVTSKSLPLRKDRSADTKLKCLPDKGIIPVAFLFFFFVRYGTVRYSGADTTVAALLMRLHA